MYCIYSVKRRGVYYIFRDSSAAFIRGWRLFKIHFISCNYGNYFNFEEQKRFSARLKCHFLYLSHFHDEHVNTTTIRRVGKVNENLMSDMLSQHYFL